MSHSFEKIIHRASRIGAATAEVFAQAGAFVFVADVNVSGGQQTVATIQAAGCKAEFVTLNVADEAACTALAAHVHARHPALDVLVNNAGIGFVGNLLTTTGADLDRMYAVNVRGVFNVSKAFVPAMLQQGRGSVINLSSTAGVEGLKDRLAYAMTKHAITGFTRCLALDHAASGLRVNCLCPGRVETPFVKARLAEYPDSEKAYREMCSTQANGRMAQPREIAAAALYLASDESAFVTGSALAIDGGWTAGMF